MPPSSDFVVIQRVQLLIHAKDHVLGDKALAHAGGRTQKRSVVQLDADVAIVSRDPALLPHLVTHIADLQPERMKVHGDASFFSLTFRIV